MRVALAARVLRPEAPLAALFATVGAALSAWGIRAAIAPIPKPADAPDANVYETIAQRGMQADLGAWLLLLFGLWLLAWGAVLLASARRPDAR